MRLELSRRSDLAIRALRALEAAEQRVKRGDLAEALSTTPDFLARVMTPLVAHRWVHSQPGPSGGYQIAAAATGVSVFDLVQAVEGVPDEGECVLRDGPCIPDEACALHHAWSRARDALLDELRESSVIE